MRFRRTWIAASTFVLAVLMLGSALQPAHAQLTISTTTSTDWKISNGAISLDWNSTTGNVWSMYLASFPSDDLVDTTTTSNGHPSGLYMDNDGTDMSNGGIGNDSETGTAGYSLISGSYLDWWISWAASGSNVFTVTEHFILQPNDPTLYSYYVVNHSSSAATGDFGQIQYVYRINLTDFVNTYSVNSGLNNLGATSIALPSEADMNTTDPGRAVQNAVVDLHGFSLPSGFGREFYTKYDYSSYEYLHRAHGVYGSIFGAWTIIPSTETFVGGPSKQDLIFTGNILMGEILSNHLDNELGYTPHQGSNVTRLYGPLGFHFNAFNSTITTPVGMYQDALNTIPSALTLFAKDSELLSNGYIPDGGGRGTVNATISGGGSSTANTAWTVLSDPETNMQYSTQGYEYWQSNNSSGNAVFTNVVPGTYRMSTYVLGEWGQLREDGVTVTAGGTTTANLTFTPENFSPSGDAPIWTIGTPDRSAHEFLHGENNYGGVGSCSGCDDREFYGNWNYWSDFAANHGAAVYYATAVGSTPATNNLAEWNYVQWGEFDPGLYAGIYNSSDDTTDGYEYIIPSYVTTLSGESGTDGVTTSVPAWTVHFATTAAQVAQGSYVDLSVGLAAAEGSLTATLNGHAATWHYINASDACARSGLSGYYQWIVFEFPTSDLLASGDNNVLTFSVSKSDGVMYDALRMEISSKGANPSTTGWHDYEYVTPSVYTAADDAVSSNNTGTVATGLTPSFTLSSSSSSLLVAQSSSGTDTISVADADGFTGSVTLAASGLPSGVTAALGTNPTTGTSVLTFTASNSATAGTSNVTITGTSGTLTAGITIALTVSPASSFTIAPSASTLSVTQGSSGTDTITVTDTGGFTGSVTLAASGLPSGVTAALGTNPTTGTSVLTFTASAAATAGASTVTITGTSGSLTATTTIALTVNPSTSASACTIGYTIGNQWQGGFGVAITIDNTGTTALTSWTLTWSFANGQTITQLWNGVETQSGVNVTVKNESYNGSIPAGGSYTGMGFNGTWTGTNAIPTAISLNGTACTVN